MINKKLWQKLNKKKLKIGDRIQLIVCDTNYEVMKLHPRNGATGTIVGRDKRPWYAEYYLTATADKKEWENPGSTQDLRNWCIEAQQPIKGTRFEKIEELSIEEMLTSSYEALRKEGLLRKQQKEPYKRFLTRLNFLRTFTWQLLKRKKSHEKTNHNS